MRITFLLPGPGRKPVGGFKVVYEYANGLAARGHAVHLVHTPRVDAVPTWAGRARGAVRYAQVSLTRGCGPRSWFSLDPRVRLHWVPALDARRIPDADVVVATAWQTAEVAAGLPESKGRGFYLIQHRETWAGPEARVMATWKLPLRKIVIARWLAATAVESGEMASYIPNGLDFEKFGVDRPPAERPRGTVMMLHHPALPWKGTADGLAALAVVHERVPELRVFLYGLDPAPPNLPSWATHSRNPSQARLRALYNEAAVFVAPSHAEGWPLPPAEAIMSGCALAATDIGGHREYAVHEETALLSPPRNPEALAANVWRLIGDDALRLRLAANGRAAIEAFTWDRAVEALLRELQR